MKTPLAVVRLLWAGAALAMGGPALAQTGAPPAPPAEPTAAAELKTAQGQKVGEAKLRETPGGVLIEVTLTNRDAMSYRMLLGRQAIGEGILVDPGASFRQPRLRYKLYDAPARR